MAKNKRDDYNAEANGDGGACPNCGCSYMERTRIHADRETETWRVRCRFCGAEAVRTVSVQPVSR